MRVIPTNELKAQKGIVYTDDHLRRLVKKGQFPKPIKLGPGRNAFIESEIDAWLEQRAAEREKVAA